MQGRRQLDDRLRARPHREHPAPGPQPRSKRPLAYQRLQGEFGLTQEQVAERVGKDRSTIANSVRLLRLPPPVRVLLERGELSMGHARALLALPDAHAIEVAARTIVAEHLSVRAAEELVRRHGQPKAGDKPPRPAPPGKSAAVRDLEERLTRSLGGPVVITERPGDHRKGGELTIRYVDLDHLDRLLERLL
jgi:ParB family chromosome partitioning protein